MSFGTANYDGGSQKKRFKIKDGDNVYRILPPWGSLSEKGHWSKYYNVVWGYKNAKGDNRPFNDCRVTNYKTKMVEVESAAYVRSAKIKAALEDLKTRAKAGEAIDPSLIEKTDKMSQTYNIEGKHYINVVNLQGDIGVLKLGVKGKQLLEEEIKKLTAKGVDPLSLDNGRYFNIFRSGSGRNTVYQVTQYKEQRVIEGGEIAEFPKIHKMDDLFITRCKSEIFDLGKLYTTPTPEQVEAIVAGGDVDVILGKADESSAGDSNGDEGENEAASTASSDNSKALSEEQAKKALEAKMAAEYAKKQEEDATKRASEALSAKAPEQPASGSVPSTQMSDEDFLKQMGL